MNRAKILVGIVILAAVLTGLVPMISADASQGDAADQADDTRLDEADKEYLNSIILMCEDARRYRLHNMFLICEAS